MATKPGLDVRHGNAGDAARERGAERTGGVSLDHQQLRRDLQQGKQRGCNRLHMPVRVGGASTTEPTDREGAQAMLGKIERWMLAGRDDQRREASVAKSGGEWGELDGFGAGADDKPDFRGLQPSP